VTERTNRVLETTTSRITNSNKPSKRCEKSKKSVLEHLSDLQEQKISQKSTAPSVPAQVKPADIDIQEAQDVIFKPNPGPQTEFLSASEQEVLYGGAAGGGKIGYEYQSILTPEGWKGWADLQVGDVICDPVTGGTQTITHLFAWETLPVWEIEFDDGTVFDTAEEHLWRYRIARDGADRARIASTSDMEKHMSERKQSAIIQTTTPVEFAKRDIKIPPYLLGCLLGDGCITTPSISYTSHEDDWPFYYDFFDQPDVKVSKQTVRFVGKERGFLVEGLRHYGLLGKKSAEKFVPEDYLWNSLETRKELLRGLMDTDGYRDPQRARAEFTTVSPYLNDAVVFLARSLGYRVTTYEKVGSYRGVSGDKVFCQKVYRTYITGEHVDDIFKLPRKKTGVVGKQLGRKVVRVNKDTGRTAKGRCISVSGEHNLYITDDFVVTHNSYAMLADPVRNFNSPHAKQLLVRRSTEELRELIATSKLLYPRAIPGIKWSERDKTWTAPSGATLWMSYLDRDDDVMRYQGQAFTWIGFDELTQWPTPFPWDYLRSRLRTTSSSGLKLYQRATSNPGGPGHHWVKKMFVDPEVPGKAFWATDTETGEVVTWPKGHSKEGQPLFKRKFIPATLFDNPYLSEDGMYEANLLSLPEHQRRRLLEGDWDVNEGAAFPEFNRHIHVIEPYDIPDSWVKFRACDYGYGSHTGVLLFAVTPAEQLVVYRELYVSKVTATDLADMILEIESGEKIRYGVLDSSLWHQRGDRGDSLAQQMIQKGCRWRPSDRSKGSRVAGKNEIHNRLMIDEFTGEPKLVFFNTCKNVIAQLPAIPLDKNNPEDVDTNSEDHLYDALRYGVRTKPRSSLFDYDPATQGTGFQIADPTFGY